MFAAVTSVRADDDRLLQNLRGDVAMRCAVGETPKHIAKKATFPGDCFAGAGPQSAALVTFPDGSIVALGASTDIQAGAYDEGMAIPVFDGTVRFDVRRPRRGAANVHFQTARILVQVRGGVGVISINGDATRIACLTCQPDGITAGIGAKPYPVPMGQVVTITNAGVVTTAPLTDDVLAAFGAAGVSTSPDTGAAAAIAGLR